MSKKCTLLGGLANLALLMGLLLASPATGQNCDCTTGCCPACVKYRYEGAPRLKFKPGCPKPICDPCHLPHYGYYATRWQPWPFPPGHNHCPVPTSAGPVNPVPPRRFHGEPPKNDREQGKEESAPNPMKVNPGSEENSSHNPQWLPPASMPRVVPEVTLPRPLSPDTVNQAVTKEPVPDRLSPTPILDPLPTPVLPLPPERKERETPTEGPGLTPASYKPGVEARRPQAVPEGPGGVAMRVVNSRRILLDYDLSDVPKPELSLLELWYTQDGKSWFKDETSIKSGSPYVVEVNKEGTYGFMMVARNPGEKSEPPSAGEAPQVWVEVDWSKPSIQLIDLRGGVGPTGRTVSLVWMATDNNLARTPITLSYSEKPEGPWMTFAANIENTGRFTWKVPNNVPRQLFIRAEAFDLVGNSGSVQTPTAVVLP